MTTSLAVLLGIVGFALLTAVVYVATGAWKAEDRLGHEKEGSFVLGTAVRDWFLWVTNPVTRASIALGLSPLVYNFVGVGFGVLAGVFFARGQFALGGWSVLLGGIADIIDGRVARATGVASPRGAFLDSTMDRFAEVGVFVGLAVWFGRQDPAMGGQALALVLVATGLGGSLLVSYTRARGESQGVLCKLGILQRAERLLLLGFGGILDSTFVLWTGLGGPGTLVFVALALIAVGTVGTAVFRTVWIARRLPTAGAEGAD